MSPLSAPTFRREGFRAGRFDQSHRGSRGARSTQGGSRPLSQSDLIRRLTGRAIAATTFTDASRSRSEIESASAHIADLLEAAGIPAIGPTSVTEVGLVTGAVREVVPYRPSQLIPATASRDRAPIVQALGYYATQANRGELLSVLVTTGGRCSATNLRARIQGLGRLISRWASVARKRYGAEVLLRTIEFTIDPAEAEDGNPYFVHAHGLVEVPPDFKLQDGQADAFLEWSRTALRTDVVRMEAVRDPEAFIRYIAKPLFTSGRVHGAPAQLPRTLSEAAALFCAVSRLKLVHAYGPFLSFLRELRSRHCAVMKADDDAETGERYIIVENARRGVAAAAPPGASTQRAPRKNRVLAISAPKAVASRYREPFVRVANYDPEIFERPLKVGDIRLPELERLWRENGAPTPAEALAEAERLIGQPEHQAARDPRRSSTPSMQSMVHTGRPSVRARPERTFGSGGAAAPRPQPRPHRQPTCAGPCRGGGDVHRDSTSGECR